MQSITLHSGKQKSILRRHPWIFSGAIKVKPKVVDGDLVRVLDAKGNFLCIGMWQNGSIAVRIISFFETDIDEKYWNSKIAAAFELRKKLRLVDSNQTNCYRLIHAEGDGLPGLIIDIYGSSAVIQCHSIGMSLQKEKIAKSLKSILGDKISSIFDKSSNTLPKRFAAEIKDEYLLSGSSTADYVLENGHKFKVNFEEGQKTGFFLDQRENRQLLTQYCAGKSVLNAFCYSGGFSVYALAAGAASVDSLDISKKAIDWTHQNVGLMEGFDGQHDAKAVDVMDFLKNTDKKYEIVVVDPPAFAKSFGKRHNAVQGYKRLNAMALKKVEKGGILFTFSCSHVVDRVLFRNTIASAAMEVGRNVRVLHQMSQPADHPISLFHPEGSYLKGLVLGVD